MDYPAPVLPPLLVLVSILAQDGCSKCDHLGVLPCTAHRDVGEDAPSAENPVLFCSFAGACAACGGALWIDCPRCEGGPRTAEITARRAAVAAWMQLDALETAMGRAVPRLETRRFALVVDVAELPDGTKPGGTKKVQGHALAHRLAQDVEHVAGRIAAHYAIEDKDYRAKMRMWIWPALEPHQKATETFLGTLARGDFKVLGRDPVLSVWTEPVLFDDVTKVRTLFAHNAAHMLLSNAFEPVWVGGDGNGGWFDAGLAHWYEYELFGRTANYCIEEATLLQNWENGVWRAALRRRLEKEQGPLLPGVFQKRTGAMTQPEHALCWSFYDYLVAEHSAALRPLLIELKKKRPARELLAKHLGLDLPTAEAAWRVWVSATYPLKGDEPRPAKKK